MAALDSFLVLQLWQCWHLQEHLIRGLLAIGNDTRGSMCKCSHNLMRLLPGRTRTCPAALDPHSHSRRVTHLPSTPSGKLNKRKVSLHEMKLWRLDRQVEKKGVTGRESMGTEYLRK